MPPGSSRSGRPATIYDVARRAGVSHQTVSRYLKGFAGIRPETRDRVKEAIAALAYQPNLSARALTTGESARIGAFTHGLDQFGPSQVLQGAVRAARAAAYWLDIVVLDTGDPRAAEEAMAAVQPSGLAGVLVLSSTDVVTRAFAKSNFDVPLVVNVEDEPDGQVRPNGLMALVEHLAGLGHQDFLHISGPKSWAAARNRVREFTAAAKSVQARSATVVEGDWSARSGHDAIWAITQLQATAIVAGNDQMALGAMRALAARGLKIPTDVSVTGIDDIPDAAYFDPPLTTARMDFEAQGRNAVERLLRSIGWEGPYPDFAPPHPPELVLRQSTAPPKRSGQAAH